MSLLDGMEGNLVPGVLPLLQDEWGFGDTAAGAIPTAMAIAGLAVALPAGYLTDRVHRTRALAMVVASWAICTVASAAATAFWMFFGVRMLLGAAAHVDNPLSSSLLTDFYPPGWRARVFALQRAAWYVGVAVGVALAGILGEAFGWRVPFLVMVVPGLVVAALVLRLREPLRGGMDGGNAVTATEPARRGLRALRHDVAELAHIATLRHVLIGVAVAFAGFNGLGYWLPSFWERSFDLGEGAAAALTGALALVATLVGAGLGGMLGDRWHAARATGRIDLAGRALLAGGALLVAALLVRVLPLQVALLLAAATCIVGSMPASTAVVADVMPAVRRGMGFALFTFLVTASSALGPLLVGAVSELTGSLRWALVVGAIPCIPGAVVLLRGRRTVAADLSRATG